MSIIQRLLASLLTWLPFVLKCLGVVSEKFIFYLKQPDFFIKTSPVVCEVLRFWILTSFIKLPVVLFIFHRR